MDETSPIVIIVFIAVIGLPIGWLVSEFRGSRGLRLTLGCLALLMSFGVAFIVGSLDRFNSNAWFTSASKQLIDASISELEAGHTDHVLDALRQLQTEFHPTYENRGRYDKHVEQAVSRMKSSQILQIDGAANRSQPIRAVTDRTSSEAGSGR